MSLKVAANCNRDTRPFRTVTKTANSPGYTSVLSIAASAFADAASYSCITTYDGITGTLTSDAAAVTVSGFWNHVLVSSNFF